MRAVLPWPGIGIGPHLSGIINHDGYDVAGSQEGQGSAPCMPAT